MMHKTLQMNIIKRFLNASEVESFIKRYEESRKTVRNAVPSKDQFEVAKLAQKVGISNASKKLNLTYTKTYDCVKRVAAYEWLNK